MGTTPSYKHSPLGILGTLAFPTEMPTHPVCAKMTKVPRGKFPNRITVKHCFFIEKTIAVSAMVIPVYHCYGSAVPSVQWRHGNYAIRKFLSSLGNFPSRISFRYAENVPTEPKGATPWRTPIRLKEKPYTPIVPQHKHACL